MGRIYAEIQKILNGSQTFKPHCIPINSVQRKQSSSMNCHSRDKFFFQIWSQGTLLCQNIELAPALSFLSQGKRSGLWAILSFSPTCYEKQKERRKSSTKHLGEDGMQISSGFTHETPSKMSRQVNMLYQVKCSIAEHCQ